MCCLDIFCAYMNQVVIQGGVGGGALSSYCLTTGIYLILLFKNIWRIIHRTGYMFVLFILYFGCWVTKGETKLNQREAEWGGVQVRRDVGRLSSNRQQFQFSQLRFVLKEKKKKRRASGARPPL